MNNYKKHIDAIVKERPQTLLVPSEEICKRVLRNKHYLTPSIISNRQILIVRRENAFCKFHTFFVFLFTMFLVYHDLKQNKIRRIDAPKYAFKHRNLPESEKKKVEIRLYN